MLKILKKTDLKFIFMLFYFLMAIPSLHSKSESIAFCLEVNGSVQKNGSIRSGVVRKGDSIYNGDKIITGGNGFISYAYIYEETNVKIYQNSVVKIMNRNISTGTASEIAIFGGKVIIETKQGSDSFIVSSPSSTCETNGSRFITEYKNQLLYDNLSYCLFTVLEGSIKIQNNISEDIMYLKSGKTIVSTKNGKFLQLDTFKSSTEIQKTLLKGK